MLREVFLRVVRFSSLIIKELLICCNLEFEVMSDSRHSTQFSGWYIYAESSRPRLQGERAVLLSPNLSGPYCLQFHFHMLGTDIDSLNAYKNSGSGRTVIFSVSGNQGDLWYSAQASLTGTEQFRVN